MKHPTPAYWAKWTLLVVGIFATGVVLVLSLPILWLPDHPVSGLVGPVAALFGLAWMVRVYRGPRDDPPAWRYRDR
jgi:hypothetical protein